MSEILRTLVDDCPECGGMAAPIMESCVPNSVTKDKVFTKTVLKCYNCGYVYDCTVVQERPVSPIIPKDGIIT